MTVNCKTFSHYSEKRISCKYYHHTNPPGTFLSNISLHYTYYDRYLICENNLLK